MVRLHDTCVCVTLRSHELVLFVYRIMNVISIGAALRAEEQAVTRQTSTGSDHGPSRSAVIEAIESDTPDALSMVHQGHAAAASASSAQQGKSTLSQDIAHFDAIFAPPVAVAAAAKEGMGTASTAPTEPENDDYDGLINRKPVEKEQTEGGWTAVPPTPPQPPSAEEVAAAKLQARGLDTEELDNRLLYSMKPRERTRHWVSDSEDSDDDHAAGRQGEGGEKGGGRESGRLVDVSEPMWKSVRRGDRVMAKWFEDGTWYIATVLSITHGGYPNAEFKVRAELYSSLLTPHSLVSITAGYRSTSVC